MPPPGQLRHRQSRAEEKQQLRHHEVIRLIIIIIVIIITIRSQSESVVRGEHPMAFMLPSVSLSEVSSEGNVVIMTS